jgi:hypothetical protein
MTISTTAWQNTAVLIVAAVLIAIAVARMFAWKHGSDLLDCFALATRTAPPSICRNSNESALPFREG